MDLHRPIHDFLLVFLGLGLILGGCLFNRFLECSSLFMA